MSPRHRKHKESWSELSTWHAGGGEELQSKQVQKAKAVQRHLERDEKRRAWNEISTWDSMYESKSGSREGYWDQGGEEDQVDDGLEEDMKCEDAWCLEELEEFGAEWTIQPKRVQAGLGAEGTTQREQNAAVTVTQPIPQRHR